MTLDELQEIAFQCDETGDFSPLEEAMVQFLGSATDAEDVWRALSLDVIGGIAFGDGRLPSPVINALIARSLAQRDAAVLGAAVRLASYEPAPTIGDDEGIKPGTAAVLASSAPLLRGVWDAAAAPLRAQLLHALAVAAALTEEDHSRVAAILEDESAAPEVLGLVLVASAGSERSAFVEAARRLLDHTSPLVALVAAAVTSRAGVPLAGRAVEVLSDALVHPAPTPGWWGFRTYETVEGTDHLALRALARADVGTPGPIVEAIVGRGDGGWFESELLVRLAFPEGPDPLGLIASELDATQRLVVEAHGREPLSAVAGAVHRLGLARPADVERFLAEQGPVWSTRTVATAAGDATWPNIRVWKAHVWDVLSAEVARGALFDPFEPEALVELACTRWRDVLLQSVGQSRTAAHRQRDRQLLVDILRAVDASSFDLGAAVVERLRDSRSSDPIALTAAVLVALASAELELEAADWEVVADGVLMVEHEPLFADLIQALPDKARQAIRDAMPED